jgi:hypothetical protein
MKCQEVNELMQRYLDKDLGDMENSVLFKHVQECAECAAVFERLKRLSDELEQMPDVDPPVSLVDSILPRLEEIDRTGAGMQDVEFPVDGNKIPEQNKIVSFKRWIADRPFKAVGGVVAAAVVFGLIIVNNPGTFKQSSYLTANESAGNASSQDMAGKASDKLLFNAPSGDSQFTAKKGAVSEESNSADEPGSFTVAEPDNKKESDGEPMGIAKVTPTSESPDKNSSGAGAPGFSGEPEIASVESHMLQASEIQISTAEEHDQYGVGMNAAASAGSEQQTSPDGSYDAKVESAGEGLRVVISNSDHRAVYVTQWFEVDQILNVYWSKDGKYLHYDVATGESMGHYVIKLQK